MHAYRYNAPPVASLLSVYNNAVLVLHVKAIGTKVTFSGGRDIGKCANLGYSFVIRTLRGTFGVLHCYAIPNPASKYVDNLQIIYA